MVSNDGLVDHYYSVPSSILNGWSIQRLMPYQHLTNHLWQQKPSVAVQNLAREFTKLAKLDCQPSRKFRGSPAYIFLTPKDIFRISKYRRSFCLVFWALIIHLNYLLLNVIISFLKMCLKKHERLEYRYWLHVLFPLSLFLLWDLTYNNNCNNNRLFHT